MLNSIPECPNCKNGTKRRYNGSSTTLLAWSPYYDKNGKLINNNPNQTTNSYTCLECNKDYTVKS